MTTKLTGRATVLVPGHRGPVPEIYRTHRLRELTAGQVPVAVRARLNLMDYFAGSGPEAFEDIRWSDGRFYRALTVAGKPLTLQSPVLKHLDVDAGGFATEEEAVRNLDEFLDGHIIIDGFLWRETTEPVLELDPDGHHILVVSNGGRFRHRSDPRRTFSLKEPDLAVETAAYIRQRSGADFDPDPTAFRPGFEILMPETITGPLHAERIEAACEEARAAVTAAVKDLLMDFTGPKMQEVGELLLKTGRAYPDQAGRQTMSAVQDAVGSLTVYASVTGAGIPGQPTPYEWRQMTFTPVAFTGDEVPVAARIPSSYTFPSVRGDETADIRTLDGHFYSQKVDVDDAPLTVGTPHPGDYIHLYFDRHESDREATAAMLTGAAGIISIDGHLWTRIEEPVLVLHPDGIWIDVLPDTIIAGKAETFALTESGQAVARAAGLRLEAGTGLEPYPSAVDPGVTVLIPSVFSTRKAGRGN